MQSNALFVVAGSLVALLSIGVAVLPNPETRTLVAADGSVTVSGLVRQTQDLTLVPVLDAPRLPLIASAFDVGPEAVVLDVPVTLTFPLRAYGFDPASLAVYRYRAEYGMWETVPEATHTQELITVETVSLGRFALGLQRTIDAPRFLSAFDEMADAAPAGTQGYEIVTGFSTEDSEIVRVQDAGQKGGCGGMFGEGDGVLESVRTKFAIVPVDDVLTNATFTLHARFIVRTDGVGCSDDMPMNALVGYDTMIPSIE